MPVGPNGLRFMEGVLSALADAGFHGHIIGLSGNATLRRSAIYKARRIADCKTFTHNPCGDALDKPHLMAPTKRSFFAGSLVRLKNGDLGVGFAAGAAMAASGASRDELGRQALTSAQDLLQQAHALRPESAEVSLACRRTQ